MTLNFAVRSRAPQPMPDAVDPEDDLVGMPVVGLGGSMPPDLRGDPRPKRRNRGSDRLAGGDRPSHSRKICPLNLLSVPILEIMLTGHVSRNRAEFVLYREVEIPQSLSKSSSIPLDRPVVVTPGSSRGVPGGTDPIKFA